MFKDLKGLGRETAVYGLSTVVGRLLNFFLLPLYTYVFTPAEYGIVTLIFICMGFLNVLYSYGMDFAFMRHADERGAFPTAFWSLAFSSVGFSIIIYCFATPLSAVLGTAPEYSQVLRYCAWIPAFDALALVPFGQLRLRHKAGRYAGIKAINIVVNLACNSIFLVRWEMGMRGVFLASLTACALTLILLAPVLASGLRSSFNPSLYGSLLRFALPMIPGAAASMVVQLIDRPILKYLTDDATVGLYQANYRLGIFMMMAVNMFDASWRPFFLQRAQDSGGRKVLARVLTYFTAGASLLFLFIALFIPHIVALPLFVGKPLIHPDYWGGLAIVPVVTLGYLFNGIYVNLLAAPAFAQRSELIAYATTLGASVNVGANLLWIPSWGMMGAAAATLAAYMAMAASLLLMGRKVYPIPYEYRRLGVIAVCLTG